MAPWSFPEECYEHSEADEIADSVLTVGRFDAAATRSYGEVEAFVKSSFDDLGPAMRDAVVEALAARCPTLVTEPVGERPARPIDVTRTNPLFGLF